MAETVNSSKTVSMIWLLIVTSNFTLGQQQISHCPSHNNFEQNVTGLLNNWSFSSSLYSNCDLRTSNLVICCCLKQKAGPRRSTPYLAPNISSKCLCFLQPCQLLSNCLKAGRNLCLKNVRLYEQVCPSDSIEKH